MDGPAYLDEALARDYVRVLAEEYDLPETLGKLCELRGEDVSGVIAATSRRLLSLQ